MNDSHRNPARDAADPSGATCSECSRELRTTELREMRERAFQLGTYGTLTFDELLCAQCAGAAPGRTDVLSRFSVGETKPGARRSAPADPEIVAQRAS